MWSAPSLSILKAQRTFVPEVFHKQVYSSDLNACVDENMLLVLEHLNAHGVKTLYSCQGTMPLKPTLMKRGVFSGTEGYVGVSADTLDAFKPFLAKTPWARLDLDDQGNPYVFPPHGSHRSDSMICVRFPRHSLRRTIKNWLSVS